jgi:hypothetical protein
VHASADPIATVVTQQHGPPKMSSIPWAEKKLSNNDKDGNVDGHGDEEYQQGLVTALEAKAMMEDWTLKKLAGQEKGPLGLGLLQRHTKISRISNHPNLHY